MISVCIATYNGAATISAQLTSIIPQLSPEDEIIISDDRSSDNTIEVIQTLKCPLIRIIQGPAAGSPIPNFENALKAAKGDYIFLSDQDDKWKPQKVQIMMKALEKADCVLSDCSITDSNFNVTHPSFFKCNNTKNGKYYNLLFKNGYIGGSMAFRRCILNRALPFPRHTPMHDLWIGNVAEFFYRMAFISESLSYFRRHGHNTSTSSQKSINPLSTRLSYRFITIRALLRLAFSHPSPKP